MDGRRIHRRRRTVAATYPLRGRPICHHRHVTGRAALAVSFAPELESRALRWRRIRVREIPAARARPAQRAGLTGHGAARTGFGPTQNARFDDLAESLGDDSR